jgi:hypothetical protein
MAGHRNLDAARRAASRMAVNVAAAVSAALVLLSVAVLSTRVRKRHRRVSGLIEPATIAFVSWQCVLCVAVVAVGASPGAKRCECLRISTICPLLAIIGRLLKVLVVWSEPIVIFRLLFLLLVISSVVLDGTLAGIQFSDPPLDAAKVEGLAALPTVPCGASLVDGVRAYDALLSPLG